MKTYERVFGNLKKKLPFGHAARNEANIVANRNMLYKITIALGKVKHTDCYYT